MKVFQKKGKVSYKETKLIPKVQEAINKLEAQNPNNLKDFKPATNIEELQALHDKYCVMDVEFTETKSNATDTKETYEQHKEFRESAKEEITSKDFKDDSDLYNDEELDNVSDPLNRNEPIINDYVQDLNLNAKSNLTQNTNINFEEPTNFKDAFEIPSDNPINEADKRNMGEPEKKNIYAKQPPQQQQKQQKEAPINPDFNDMSGGKKKRSTKKMAKYIVEVICMLAEKGFVWYANKDINENKLAEYELSGEIDLRFMVTLTDNQRVTVKEYFLRQCFTAEQLAKIDEEEKNDLIDALAEVMMEKGIAPTPMQELILISVKMFGGQAAKLMVIKAETSSILNQLRGEPIQQVQQQQTKTEPIKREEPIKQPEPEKPKEPTVEYFETQLETKKVAVEKVQQEGDFNSLGIINVPIETKE